MCFDMRMTCQSNKNISYWDLVSLAHKNTVYLNGHVSFLKYVSMQKNISEMWQKLLSRKRWMKPEPFPGLDVDLLLRAAWHI